MSWIEFKDIIEQYSGLERDALHIHGALLLYVLAMFAFRQSRRSRFPWLVVLAVEMLNEAFDLRHQYRSDGVLEWSSSAKDLWNTMLWPTVLLLVGRYTNLFQHRTRLAAQTRRSAKAP